MKRLYVLRHAEAAPAGGFADFKRPLTEKGLEDAHRLGQHMKEKNYRPDQIFCSPALRTSETLSCLLESLGKIQTEFLSLIYEGGLPDLRHILAQSGDIYQSILLIGHNPSIHQLAFDLSKDSGDFVNQLNTGYPPATLSVLDCPIENWASLKSSENKLRDIVLAD